MAAVKLRIEPTIGPTSGPLVQPLNAPVVSAPRRELPERSPRPRVLSLFAVVYILSGAVTSWLMLSGAAVNTPVGLTLALSVDWPHVSLTLSLMSVTAGGLLLARGPAGWYLAVAVLVDSLLNAAVGLALLPWDGTAVSLLSGSALSAYATLTLRAMVAIALMWCFFTRDIRNYCRVRRGGAWRAVVLLACLEIALFSYLAGLSI